MIVKWIECGKEVSQFKEMLRELSDNEITPTFIGSCVVGHWNVIVHELVDALPIDIVLQENPNMSETVIKNAKELCNKMHKLGYVHGDLRTPNILVNNKSGRVWLVDFDHAGKYQETKYPLFLNPDIKWPDNAKAGALVEPEHDMYWIEQLNK